MTHLNPDWFAEEAVQAFIAFCAEHSLSMRFVGGCVRDTLIGRVVGDIDVATSATPEQVINAVKSSPYKAIPTGIAHGTVTVVVHGKPFEMTTLRKDTACDGRHAKVQFSDDWELDAKRRDFTFNALMLDSDGTLYDYTGGIEDALIGKVRFIGMVHDRIAEDYLRILRYFRFYALYGKTVPDKDTLDALQENADGLLRLSPQRIAQEMYKLLGALMPMPALILMRDTNVLGVVCPGATPDMAALEQLNRVEQTPNALMRLHVLYPADAMRFAQQWHFSKAQQRVLSLLATAPAITTAHEVRLALYRHSRAMIIAILERDAAISKCSINSQLLELAQHAPIPVFPVNGEMLLKLGAVSGQTLGHALKHLEEEWIGSDFTLTQEQLLMPLNHAI